MHRINKKSLSSTPRPLDAYQKASRAATVAANRAGLKTNGWRKTHPSDPCRKTVLLDKNKAEVGKAWCFPSGNWEVYLNTQREPVAFGQEHNDVCANTIMPEHTRPTTATIGNHHEEGLTLA